MLIKELIPVLRGLNRADKWLIVQLLVSELAREEGAKLIEELGIAGRTFEVWSPEASVGAADALMAALKVEVANV